MICVTMFSCMMEEIIVSTHKHMVRISNTYGGVMQNKINYN